MERRVCISNVRMERWTRSVSHYFTELDAFEGEHSFTGRDPEHSTYRGRAHLSEMIALLGPLPPSLVSRANLRSKSFSEQGEWMVSSQTRSQTLVPLTTRLSAGEFSAGIPLPPLRYLQDRETTLQGQGNTPDKLENCS